MIFNLCSSVEQDREGLNRPNQADEGRMTTLSWTLYEKQLEEYKYDRLTYLLTW